MLELATVRPLLSSSIEAIVPSEGCSTVLTPKTVMDLEEVCIPAFGVPSTPRWSRTGVHNDGVAEIRICEMALVVVVGEGMALAEEGPERKYWTRKETKNGLRMTRKSR